MPTQTTNPYHDPATRFYFRTASRRKAGARRHQVVEKSTGAVVSAWRTLSEAREDCSLLNRLVDAQHV